MCYPKPGPRCSARAAANLQRAKLREETAKGHSFELVEAVTAAQLEYDSTPAGQLELERRIQQQMSRDDYIPDDDYAAEYQLRLDLGRAKRVEQLAAIRSKERGDLTHTAIPNAVHFPAEFHTFRQQYNDVTSDEVKDDYLMNQPEIVDLLIKDSQTWTARLSPAEMEAAAWFTSNGSSIINNHLVGRETNWRNDYDMDQERAAQTAATLDSAIRKSKRDTPIKIYRGLSTETLAAQGYKYGESEKFITDNFKVGETWSSPVFQSTTLDYRKAQGFARSGVMLEILGKTAAPVTNVSAWDFSEAEYVVNRNQQYRVAAVKHFTRTLTNGRGKEFHYDEHVVQLEEI